MSHKSATPRRSTAKDARAKRSSAALQAALLALLEEKPFDQISVREICAASGTHYATFFRHHAGKEELLDLIASDQINTLVDLALPVRDSVGQDRAFHLLCDYVAEHRALWSTLLNGGAGPAMRREWLKRAKIVAQELEQIGSWLPKELATICSVSLIVETIAWWLAQPEGEHSPAEIAEILHRLVSRSPMAGD